MFVGRRLLGRTAWTGWVLLTLQQRAGFAAADIAAAVVAAAETVAVVAAAAAAGPAPVTGFADIVAVERPSVAPVAADIAVAAADIAAKPVGVAARAAVERG